MDREKHMINLKITENGKSKCIETQSGETLLTILQKNDYSVYAPCGGKGTCGKCLVQVKNEGYVTACTYYPEKNAEIILPGEVETTVLTSQSDYLEDLPLDIEPTGFETENPYGVAIDMGTTTVVLYFLDMRTGIIRKVSTFINPQNTYGGDVITRIGYCQEHQSGRRELQQAFIKAMNRVLEDYAKEATCTTRNIERLVFAGNTTMLHILLGEDPVSLALAPFVPKFTDKQIRMGEQTEFKVNAHAHIETLPCLSAYVGADIVAGLAALNVPYRNYLFLDIGTNGEIALVKGDEILTCATAAGPAFEGANISCGMSAVSGAIHIFKNKKQYKVIGNIRPMGICGSGLVDIVSYLVQNKAIDETGLLKEDFVIHEKNNIRITQQDIREIQLAKSAVYSGIKILLDEAKLSFDSIEALFIAGGFGNYINIQSALTIGLLPHELKDKIYAVGNSAGIGALQYTKSNYFKLKTEAIVKKSRYIELSLRDEFAMEFALNMNFS
jgi:uncharacterized 2Fe-2S/4Fe-4S cluster protein (DUF4445 family)